MSTDVEEQMGAVVRRAERPEGSYFPAFDDGPLSAHGRLEDVVVTVLSENPPIELREYRSRADSRQRCDVTSVPNFYDWLHEVLGTAVIPGIFKRASELIRVPRIGEEGWEPAKVGDDGPAQIRPLTGLGVLDIIQHKFWVYREKVDRVKDENSSTGEKTIITRTHAMVPLDIVRLPVDSPAEWEAVPNVAGVTHTPMMRENGTVLNAPGYDAPSELLYIPDPGWQELKHPAVIDHRAIDWSTRVLNELVEDFPFEHPLYKMNYFALLLTPLMRAMTKPPYPMFIVNAHQRGTGKSLLARVARELHGGVHRPELPTDTDEIRKQFTAILISTTAPIVVFDNITQPIRNGNISNLLTTSTWSDRPLGRSGNVQATNDRIWVATGNNVQIGGDMARRTRYITLDAVVANPEFRTGFKIPDLIGYVKSNRGTYITALLIQIMWWVQRGAPVKESRADDYQRWEGAMIEILEGGGLDPDGHFAGGERARGIGGIVSTIDEDELGDLLAMLSDTFGGKPFQVKDIKKFAETITGAEIVDEVMPFTCTLARDRYKSLGRWMDGKNKSVANDLRLVQMTQARGGWVYRLESVPTIDPTKGK